MKKLLLILILTLSFQTLSKADDIRDFQIEGMSIGDSLLDYFSEDEIKIKLNNANFTTKKQYSIITIPKLSTSSKYDTVSITLKSNDKKYKIFTIDGILYYNNNIKKCYKEQDIVVKEISNLFPEITPSKGKIRKHRADKTGKTTVKNRSFRLSKGLISIGCNDWSKDLTSKKGWKDSLRIGIVSQEYLDTYKLN